MAKHAHTTTDQSVSAEIISSVAPPLAPVSRRAMIGASAAILAAGVPIGALAATDAAGPDAELIRTCAQHVINLHAYNHNPDGDGSGLLLAAYERTRDAISEAKPQTVAGMIAKARAARVESRFPDGTESPDGSMAGSWSFQLVYDLLRMAGDDVPEPEPIDRTPSPPPVPAEFPDAALLALCAEYHRCAAERIARQNDPNPDGAEIDDTPSSRARDREWTAFEAVAAAGPARTQAGRIAKACVALKMSNSRDADDDLDDDLRFMRATLAELAGFARDGGAA